MSKICGIYKITSPTGSIYIGLSKNIYKRWCHYKNDEPLCKKQIKLYRSLKKYGWDNHTFEILQECKEHELDTFERFYIFLYDTFNTKHGMNLTNGGGKGIIYSEKSIAKRVKKMKGRKQSPETIAKRVEKILGRKYSNEHKEKIRLKAIGRSPSKETKNKMSISKKNRKRFSFSDTHKNNIKKSKILLSGKKVIQLDNNSNYIKTWDCIRDISRELKIDISSIIRVCKGKQKTSLGFIWKYEDEKNKLTTQPSSARFGSLNKNSKKIVQYDLKLKFIKSWDCTADAARELKINASNISAVCKGKDKTYKGFIWKYDT